MIQFLIHLALAKKPDGVDLPRSRSSIEALGVLESATRNIFTCPDVLSIVPQHRGRVFAVGMQV